MFEKLNRLRLEHERAQARFEEAKQKLEESGARLKAEEAASILGIVDSLKFTPEQLAEYLGVKDEKASPEKKKEKPKKTSDVTETKDSSEPQKDENDGIMEDILNESY